MQNGQIPKLSAIVEDSDSEEEPDAVVNIPINKVKLVVGAGGEKIKYIQRKSKCRLQVCCPAWILRRTLGWQETTRIDPHDDDELYQRTHPPFIGLVAAMPHDGWLSCGAVYHAQKPRHRLLACCLHAQKLILTCPVSILCLNSHL